MTEPTMLGRPVSVLVRGLTHPGRRRAENQDDLLIADLSGAEPPVYGHAAEGAAPDSTRRFSLGQKGMLVMVADGMGGAAGGATASRIAVEEVYREMMIRWSFGRDSSADTFQARLGESVREANAAICRRAEADPALRGMGTTATVGGVVDGVLYLAQVGDSRAYLVRDGVAVRLTRDQSLVQQLVDSGVLTAEEAERSANSNLLLQALGAAKSVEVELTVQELRRGDAVLVCSDGLFRMVSDVEIGDGLTPRPDGEDGPRELVELANERGGPDNVTAVVLRFEG